MDIAMCPLVEVDDSLACALDMAWRSERSFYLGRSRADDLRTRGLRGEALNLLLAEQLVRDEHLSVAGVGA